MNNKKVAVLSSISCNECMDNISQPELMKMSEEELDEKIGRNTEFEEQILKNGSVKCIQHFSCGHKEIWYKNAEIRTRDEQTGIVKCEKCGFEYFLTSLPDKYAFNRWCFDHGYPPYNVFETVFLHCPNCNAPFSCQKNILTYSKVLMHNHGKYGWHPITRKHKIYRT